MRDHLHNLIRDQPDRLILDLATVTFLDSSGIGLFVGLYKALAGYGGQILLVNVGYSVAQPMRITAVDTVIDIHYADPPPSPA